jgi:recombination protein RecT
MNQATNIVQTTQHSFSSDWHGAIEDSRDKFLTFGDLDFDQEQIFATQALLNNDYLLKLAKANPTSLKLAMYNVAALGLSLNPNMGLAYLIPRKGSITVDISYRGLIAIGLEAGAIKWSKAELVYENDSFTYRGPAEKPTHECNPFDKSRGDVIGGYCIAELVSGGYMIEAMSKGDMDHIKRSSDAFQKGYGPWVDWESQMQLKSIVKRAYKWWPKSTPRMAQALSVLNEENGEGLAVLVKNDIAECLPPPPERDDVSEELAEQVDRFVNRAIAANAWEACRELIHTRIKNPSDLSFALSELDKAKAESDESNLKVANGN